MTKAIAIVLGIALGASTVLAQPKKAAPKSPKPKKPPAGAPAPKDPPAPAPTPLGPDQEKANPDAKLPTPDPNAPVDPNAKPVDPNAKPVDPNAKPVDPNAPADPNAKPADAKPTDGAKPMDSPQRKIPEVSAERRTAATKAFREGNSFLNDGIFPKAVERYAEALKNWDHPAIHYNMALALMYLDRPIEQYESLQNAIQYGQGPLEKDKFDHAREYMVLVEKQLATIEVSCQKEGARVAVDGKEVFVVEKGKPNVHKARVRIGKHTFVAEKPGFASFVDAPFIGPGETFRIELKLYTAEELTRYKRRWKERAWAPWVVVGSGALVGLIGGALQLSASSNYRDFDTQVARCNTDAGNIGCDAKAAGIADLRDSADTKRAIGIVGYGLAGAAIATGAVLVYLNRSTAYQITSEQYRLEEIQREQAQQKAVSVVPLVGPGTGGAMVMGRF